MPWGVPGGQEQVSLAWLGWVSFWSWGCVFQSQEDPEPWFLPATGFSSPTSCPTVPHPHCGPCWTASSMPQVSAQGTLCFPLPDPSQQDRNSDQGCKGDTALSPHGSICDGPSPAHQSDTCTQAT